MSSDDETFNAQPSTSGWIKDDSSMATESPASDEHIRIRVITSDTNNEVHFQIKPAQALGRLKRSYCRRLGIQIEELRFVFDGHRITDDDTPQSLGMVNDDIIEIYQERTGGYMWIWKENLIFNFTLDFFT